MNKLSNSIICVILACFTTILGSCGDDDYDGIIWDINPIMFHLKIINKDSVNLLNDTTIRNFYKERVKISYKGKEYRVSKIIDYEDSLKKQSRAYNAVFKGFWLQNYWVHNSSRNFIFRFGEFDGTKSYENETLIIDWGDGATDEIVFNNNFYMKNDEPRITRSFYLNDVLAQEEYPLFEVIHIPNTY